MKKYIWVNWSNVDYSKHPVRRAYRKIAGGFEFAADRFGIAEDLLEIPSYNIMPTPKYNLNNIDTSFEDRYYSLLDSVGKKVFETAAGRPIALMYSGGVDSVVILAAMMRQPEYKEYMHNQLISFFMTSNSIDEYPWLFYNHILHTNMMRPLNYNTMMNGEYLVVNGDMGDHIIGTSDVFTLTNDSSFDISSRWDSFFDIVDEPHYVEMCRRAKQHEPFPLETVHQFVWWINQCYALQDELVKPYYWSNTQDFSEISTQNKVFRFFNDPEFITFSYELMSTNPKHRTYEDCKLWSKKYILNHFGDEEYLWKPKVFSQRLTLRTVEKSQIYIYDGVIGSAMSGVSI
jgi:hypothetical protein